MHQEILLQILASAKKTNLRLFNELNPEMTNIMQKNGKAIQFMQENKFSDAKEMLFDHESSLTKNKIRSILNKYYLNFDIETNESAIVMVKVATKNTERILLDNLRTSVIIFINAIIFSIIFALASARAISQPIDLLSENMDKITSENLDIPINPKLLKLKGDVGILARSFSKLLNRLHLTTVSRNALLDEIEQRIKIEENLRITAEHLEESNRELDQFAYSTSHDLRSPLRGIENLADWIKEDCYELLPETSRKHLDLIKERTKRLDTLIQSILEYARAGTVDSHAESVNLNLLLNEVIDSLAAPQHIKISIDIPLPTIVTHKVLITRVFLNLINNAVKFNDKKQGEIHIGYKNLKSYYQFYVADNGPGIDPRFHNKIFEIFQTLQPRDTIEGAGIGLALVKKIVEKQGGKLKVKSTLGEGATFYFTWPKDKPNA